MNNRYGDNGYREDRQRGRFGQSRDYGRGQDDRGFFDRAGDEVRSWFGDEEAERRREADELRWEREQGMSGRRDNQSGDASAGYGGTGSGWGNQEGNSWNRDRPGSGGSYGAYGGSDYGRERSDRNYGPSRSEERQGGFASAGGSTPEVFGEPGQGGTSGFGGYPDHGRRFDRIDPGHVGTQGAHPMSSPVGGAYGGAYGIGATGAAGSAARYAGASQGGTMSGGRGGDLHDPHYSEWRNRQIESLDRDYDEYRREHQSKFEQDFGNWRSRRGEQRQSIRKVTEHMEVIGSDGEKIGTVDAVRDDRIILAKNDENAGGHHHSIPCSWIESVDDKVTVNKSREEATNAWRDEERNRALFEREDQGSNGPHVLNRSFSGTY